MTETSEAAGVKARARHYARFYGLEPVPTDRPLAIVHGNCQAESLRVVLEASGMSTARMPPAHELQRSDLPHLNRLLGAARIVISQPIRPSYRGLPVGTEQLLSRCPLSPRVVLVPVIRFAGLYPAHAIVRPPSDPSLTPPIVAYHDLRILAEAAGRVASERRPTVSLCADTVREIAADSLNELRMRERAHDTVVVSDLLRRPHFGLMRTINHPGNPIWRAVAQRVQSALGLRGDVAIDRPLLDSVHAPREPAVIRAFRLDEEPRAHWIVAGTAVDAATVRAAHLAWYATHPDAVQEGVRRHRRTLAQLLGR